MSLSECQKNKICKIVSVNIDDIKIKLRLYEIGFFVGNEVTVLNHTLAKKTMLISVLDSCFIIKSDIAKSIEVKYG